MREGRFNIDLQNDFGWVFTCAGRNFITRTQSQDWLHATAHWKLLPPNRKNIIEKDLCHKEMWDTKSYPSVPQNRIKGDYNLLSPSLPETFVSYKSIQARSCSSFTGAYW